MPIDKIVDRIAVAFGHRFTPTGSRSCLKRRFCLGSRIKGTHRCHPMFDSSREHEGAVRSPNLNGSLQLGAQSALAADGHAENPEAAASDRAHRKAMLDEAIRTERRAVLVVNTRSRNGRDLYSEAKRLLTRSGLHLDAAYPVRRPVRLPEIVQDAVAQDHRLIIVGGGDGTVSSVVDYLAYRDAVLGILPLGTANSFARALDIPLDLAGAAEILTGGGKVADVDLGRINDDYFANTAAIGLPALVGRGLPHGLKRWFGKAGYLLVGAALFARHKPFRAVLTAGHREVARIEDALDILIANGPYQGGVKVAGAAHPESRDLVIRIVKGGRKANLLRTWARPALNNSAAEFTEIVRASDLVIETDPPHYVSIDGEVVTRTPVRVSVARQALLLMAPREQEGVS
jgi:YegS/Rv2252/BmrU family lipid kinase